MPWWCWFKLHWPQHTTHCIHNQSTYVLMPRWRLVPKFLINYTQQFLTIKNQTSNTILATLLLIYCLECIRNSAVRKLFVYTKNSNRKCYVICGGGCQLGCAFNLVSCARPHPLQARGEGLVKSLYTSHVNCPGSWQK